MPHRAPAWTAPWPSWRRRRPTRCSSPPLPARRAPVRPASPPDRPRQVEPGASPRRALPAALARDVGVQRLALNLDFERLQFQRRLGQHPPRPPVMPPREHLSLFHAIARRRQHIDKPARSLRRHRHHMRPHARVRGRHESRLIDNRERRHGQRRQSGKRHADPACCAHHPWLCRRAGHQARRRLCSDACGQRRSRAVNQGRAGVVCTGGQPLRLSNTRMQPSGATKDGVTGLPASIASTTLPTYC